MRQAYLIMAHEDDEQLAALVKRLCPPGSPHQAVIHIDRRSPLWRDAGNLIASLPSARLVPSPAAVHWGHASQVRAITHLLREALQTPWDLAHLISGADWPVNPVPPTGLCHIEAVPSAQADRMEGFRLDARWLRPDPARPLHWYPARALRKLSAHLPRRMDTPWGPWHKGATWWSLPRAACETGLAELERGFALGRWPQGRWQGTVCADEHALPTIIARHYPDRLAPIHRFQRWQPGAASPEWLTAADWPAAQASGAWFARKLARRVDPFFLALP